MRGFLCTLLLLAGIATAQAAVPQAETSKKILVLGDSLSAAHNIAVSAGWVHLLDARLQQMEPGWSVINASISGETSISGRNRLPALLAQNHPRIVILELGANDGLQGLALDQLKGNLQAMIEASKKAGARVLLLGIELPVNYGPQYRDGLRAVYADLSKQDQVGLLPFLLDGVALNPNLMQEDGLHPTAEGEPIVLNNVWGVLKPLLH